MLNVPGDTRRTRRSHHRNPSRIIVSYKLSTLKSTRIDLVKYSAKSRVYNSMVKTRNRVSTSV